MKRLTSFPDAKERRHSRQDEKHMQRHKCVAGHTGVMTACGTM